MAEPCAPSTDWFSGRSPRSRARAASTRGACATSGSAPSRLAGRGTQVGSTVTSPPATSCSRTGAWLQSSTSGRAVSVTHRATWQPRGPCSPRKGGRSCGRCSRSMTGPGHVDGVGALEDRQRVRRHGRPTTEHRRHSSSPRAPSDPLRRRKRLAGISGAVPTGVGRPERRSSPRPRPAPPPRCSPDAPDRGAASTRPGRADVPDRPSRGGPRARRRSGAGRAPQACRRPGFPAPPSRDWRPTLNTTLDRRGFFRVGGGLAAAAGIVATVGACAPDNAGGSNTTDTGDGGAAAASRTRTAPSTPPSAMSWAAAATTR